MAENIKDFKVVLLGEDNIGSVGKTSIFKRFMNNEFDPHHNSTIEASFSKKRINLPNGKRVIISLWDTAGQEKYHSLVPIYYRDANGAVLVYDITDKDSFLRVQNWVKELRKMLGGSVVLAIAGNKIDLEKNRVVSLEEAEKYASEVGATHFNTSAKLNKGINELFPKICEAMLKESEESEKIVFARKKSNIVIENDETSTNVKNDSTCC